MCKVFDVISAHRRRAAVPCSTPARARGWDGVVVVFALGRARDTNPFHKPHNSASASSSAQIECSLALGHYRSATTFHTWPSCPACHAPPTQVVVMRVRAAIAIRTVVIQEHFSSTAPFVGRCEPRSFFCHVNVCRLRGLKSVPPFGVARHQCSACPFRSCTRTDLAAARRSARMMHIPFVQG